MENCRQCNLKAYWFCECRGSFMCNEHFGSHFESSEQHKYKKILHKLLPETKASILNEYQSRIAQLSILEDNIIKTTNTLIYTIKQFCSKSLDYLSSLQQSYLKICFLDEANDEVLKEIQDFLSSKLDITEYQQINHVEGIEKYFSQIWAIEKKFEENLELEKIIEKEPEPKIEEKKQDNNEILCDFINEGNYSVEKGAVLMNLGCVHFKKEAYKESEEAFCKALEHYEKILDPNNSLIAAIHSNLGKVYFNIKQYEKSIEHLIKCSIIYEQTRSPDDQDLESTYEIIGDSYNLIKNKEKSYEYYEKVLQKKILNNRLEDVNGKIFYRKLAEVYFSYNFYEKSLEMYFKAIEIIEKLYGPKNSELIDVYFSIAVAYSQLKKDENVEFFKKSFEIKAMINPEDPDLGNLAAKIAHIYHERKKFKECNEYFIKATEYFEKNLPDTAKRLVDLYFNIGIIAYNLKNFSESEIFLNKSIKIEDSYGFSEDLRVKKLLILDEVYEKTGKIIEMQQIREEIQKIYESNTDKYAEQAENFFRKLINFTLSAKNYDKAIEILVKVTNLCEKKTQIPQDLGDLYNLISSLKLQNDEFEEALNYRIKASGAFERIFGKHAKVGLCYMNIGDFYMRTDENKSEEYYKKALELYRELNIKDENFRNLLLRLADHFYNKDRFEESEEHYKLCLKEYESLNDDNPDVAKIYFSLGNLYLHRKMYDESEKTYCKALMIYEKNYPPEHPQVVNLKKILLNFKVVSY
ncbi:hypothetical protein SteCoe_31053 [Stentor coeruleus]|uniref:Uncharacterized protein n=1 Tax=Stentor coeruleus TaxID=5963 RepID=A0A1R2B263_9CILI|nr:hypothetical protein SteCoe_31053 [Stentor coeruleus]